MRITHDGLSLKGLRHGFFTRQGGVSEGLYASLNIGLGSHDDRERVLANRGRVAAELGVPAGHLVMPYQIHSPDVAVIDRVPRDDARPQVDALVTRTPGLAIGVSTADCGPILFADPQARVVGAAHAGWKGAFGGVIEATVAAMEREGAERDSITAVLGPTISRQSYEVGAEFHERFVNADPDHARFFEPGDSPGHHWFDLPAFILMRLARCGVGTAVNLDLCTYRDEERFFSYRRTTHRREPDYGRLVSAIALVD
jgi:hypothetical protein